MQDSSLNFSGMDRHALQFTNIRLIRKTQFKGELNAKTNLFLFKFINIVDELCVGFLN